MTNLTPDFLRRLVYRDEEKRYEIESTCKQCGNMVISTVYTWVPDVEQQHAEQCLKNWVAHGQAIDLL